MSGDGVTLPIYVVPHSRDWHQASHSLAFWFVWWLSGAELVTSHFNGFRKVYLLLSSSIIVYNIYLIKFFLI